MGSNKHWSIEEVEFLKSNNYLTPEELSGKLNRTSGSIWAKANNLGIALAYNQYHWDEKSIDILRRNYDKLTSKELADILGTTPHSVEMKAFTLNIKKNKQSVWTDDEIEFLKNNYDKYKYKELAIKLNKNVKTIAWQMRKYGLERVSREKWTVEEEKFLSDNKHLTHKEIAEKLNRPIGSVKKKIQKLGITAESEYFRWTSDKVEQLRKLYIEEQLPSSQIAEKLNTTKQSVEMKIFKLGFRKDIYVEWSLEDLEYLKNFYKTKTYEQIAVDLGRTKDAVRSKFRELDLGSKDDKRRWSENEIRILKQEAPNMDSKELSEKLDRNIVVVLKKAREYGVKIKNNRFDWNEETEQILRENYLVLDNNQLALKLKTTRGSVKHRLVKLGLIKVMRWSEDDIEYVKNNYKESAVVILAEKLNRTEPSIKHMARILGISKDRPYIFPERTVGLTLINLLGTSKVKAQYNEGVEVPNKILFPHPIILRVDENEVVSTYMRPDYELYHEKSKMWIPSEYFGFSGEMYELRKRIKKSFLKRKYGDKFTSFNIEDLRNPDMIKVKLEKAGYIVSEDVGIS